MSNVCLKCGNELDKDYVCSNCGLKIDIYKKIQNTSKLLYNQGLQKAKLRDLSGAIDILNRSLKLDKNNIDARNLLGLIYFEIGEVVSALKQWVISKHIKEEDNIAGYYIEKIHRNQHKLDTLNSAVKKYNQAIGYIEQKSEDLAIIQLKKVISLNPKFIKAYCLLALCYIHQNNIAKAKKYLLKVLAIDKNNYIALKYYEDITMEDEEDEELYKKDTKEESFSVRKPIKREGKLNTSILQLIYVIFGVIIGLLVAVFLIIPGKVKGKTEELDALKKEMVVEKEKYDDELDVITQENEQLKVDLDEKSKRVTEFEEKVSHYDAVDDLQDAFTFYLNDDDLSAANKLYVIKKENLQSASSKQLYNKLVAEIYPKVSKDAFNTGSNLYRKGKSSKNEQYLNDAITQLQLSSKFAGDVDYLDDLLYYEARSYQLSGKNQEALTLFEKLLSQYPNSSFKGWAQDYVNILKQ